MSKSRRGTGTNRRGRRPIGTLRPYKPIPVITEYLRSKTLVDVKSKRTLVERLKEWGGRIRRLFSRKKKRRITTKTIKSKWKTEDRPQWAIDLGRHKANQKARNRRNRKQTLALHQMQWKRA